MEPYNHGTMEPLKERLLIDKGLASQVKGAFDNNVIISLQGTNLIII